MAKIELKLTKEQYDSLDESLKQYYVDTQDGAYELDGVGSVIRALESKRNTKDQLIAELEELRGYKAEQEAAQEKAAQADLEAKGKYEEALSAKEKAWNERYEAEKAAKEALFSDVHRERLTNELIKRGAMADRADYLVNDLLPTTELYKSSETGKYDLRKKGGIGDAAEFDGIIATVRERTPFFFESKIASGSGASGSNSGSGGSDTSNMTAAQKLEQFYAANTK